MGPIHPVWALTDREEPRFSFVSNTSLIRPAPHHPLPNLNGEASAPHPLLKQKRPARGQGKILEGSGRGTHHAYHFFMFLLFNIIKGVSSRGGSLGKNGIDFTRIAVKLL